MTECTCEYLPQKLLFIDEGLQSHIRLLNTKGYYTMSCCEGHYRDGQPDPTIYIAFARDSADVFPPLPEGFFFERGMGGDVIRYKYQCVRNLPVEEDVFENEKSTALGALLKWTESLCNHPYIVTT